MIIEIKTTAYVLHTKYYDRGYYLCSMYINNSEVICHRAVVDDFGNLVKISGFF